MTVTDEVLSGTKPGDEKQPARCLPLASLFWPVLSPTSWPVVSGFVVVQFFPPLNLNVGMFLQCVEFTIPHGLLFLLQVISYPVSC